MEHILLLSLIDEFALKDRRGRLQRLHYITEVLCKTFMRCKTGRIIVDWVIGAVTYHIRDFIDGAVAVLHEIMK